MGEDIVNVHVDRIGQVWAHKIDEHRIYLLVRVWDNDPDGYVAVSLYDGKSRRFKVGARTKLRFRRVK